MADAHEHNHQQASTSSRTKNGHQNKSTSNKKKRPLTSISLDHYESRFDRASEQFFDHLHGSDHRWLRRTETDTGDRLAPQEWSTEDVTLFFKALARRSRWRPDLISEDLDGRKTAVQVAAYIDQLEHAAKFAPSTGGVETHPAAREVSDEWITHEEKFALELQSKQADKGKRRAGDQNHSSDLSSDQKVCNAVLFLQSQCEKSESSRSRQVSTTKDATDTVSLPAFTFAELSSMMQLSTAATKSDRGHPRQSYKVFDSDHPLPPLHPPRSTGRPKKIKRRRKAKDDEDPHDEPTVPVVGAHRVLLRAVELGLLVPIQKKELSTGDDNAERPHVFKCNGRIMRGRNRLKSTQEQPLPLDFLDEIEIVFVGDLAKRNLVDPKKQNTLQSGLSLFKKTSDDALKRVLSSVTEKELIWLSEEDAPIHAQTPKSSPKNRGGRGKTATEYRGYSLVGMSPEEITRFRGRVASREARSGTDHAALKISPYEIIPPDQNWRGVNGQITHSWNKGKFKILDIFKEVLKLLDADQREAEVLRLKKQARKFGIDRFVEKEKKALNEGKRYEGGSKEIFIAALERGIRSVEEATAGDQEISQVTPPPPAQIDSEGEVEGEATSQISSKAGPSSTVSHSSSGGERFRAIGHTRTSARTFLGIAEDAHLFDLKTIAKYLSASVMASCTRPDESDSLIDQETPLRLDYLATTARMQSELRTFLSTLMLSALNAAELEGRSEKGVERKHVEYALKSRQEPESSSFANTAKRILEHQHSSQDSAVSNGELIVEEDEESDQDLLDMSPLVQDRSLSEDDLDDDIPHRDEIDLTAEQSDSDDEMFESHYEAAQVLAVRSQWGTQSQSLTFSLTGGFYWPTKPIARSHSRDIKVEDLGDVLSLSEDGLESEGEECPESEDEMDVKDRKRDLEYEEVEWKKWFGEDRPQEVEIEAAERDSEQEEDEQSESGQDAGELEEGENGHDTVEIQERESGQDSSGSESDSDEESHSE